MRISRRTIKQTHMGFFVMRHSVIAQLIPQVMAQVGFLLLFSWIRQKSGFFMMLPLP
jgi:hypothetical protein